MGMQNSYLYLSHYFLKLTFLIGLRLKYFLVSWSGLNVSNPDIPHLSLWIWNLSCCRHLMMLIPDTGSTVPVLQILIWLWQTRNTGFYVNQFQENNENSYVTFQFAGYGTTWDVPDIRLFLDIRYGTRPDSGFALLQFCMVNKDIRYPTVAGYLDFSFPGYPAYL